MKKTAMPRSIITLFAMKWLFFSYFLALLPQFDRLPPWALLTALGIAGWRLLIDLRGLPRPGRGIMLILTLGISAMILLYFHTFFGLLPGSTGLLLLSALKLLELKNRRDFSLVALLSFFLLLTFLLHDQTIPALLYVLCSCTFLVASLLALNNPLTTKKKNPLRRALVLVTTALPLALIFFFFFPRNRGPLFLLPHESHTQYSSGFRDFLRPDQVARLAQSKEIAFRVSFPAGNPPQPEDLYFRGAVLRHTDGLTWTRGAREGRPRELLQPDDSVSLVEQFYSLTKENQNYFFALDYPVQTSRAVRIVNGQVLRKTWSDFTPTNYQVFSQLSGEWPEELFDSERREVLQLPEKIAPEVRQLAQSWREQAGNQSDIMAQALNFFAEQGFRYTTRPGLYSEEDFLSSFLFRKKRGFCEHYAAAFTMLMRLAGLPARVVVGYQGGVYNPVGNYLAVRQSDAHAWTEVWQEGRGWIRIDPTAVVIPERLSIGSEILDYLKSGGEGDFDFMAAWQRALRRGFLRRLLLEINHYIDVINNKWNLWIISFDRREQRRLFRSLGISPKNPFLMALALICAALALIMALSFRFRDRVKVDQAAKAFGVLQKRLENSGLRKISSEGSVTFLEKAARCFPHAAGEIREIKKIHAELRFGRERAGRPAEITRLLRLIKKLQLKKP